MSTTSSRFILYLFCVINDSVFNLMMLIESGILLKNHINCNWCQNVTSQFHSDNLRELEISLFTCLVHRKIFKLVCRFDLINWKDKAILRYFRWIIFKQIDISQKYKTSCSLKTTTYSHGTFTWLSSAIKQLLKNFNFELLQLAFNFFCT